MAVGFVLVSAKPMEEHAVYNALLKVEEIIEVHPLFGEYDLILKIDAGSVEEVGEIVVNRVRIIEGVIDTKTLTGVRI